MCPDKSLIVGLTRTPICPDKSLIVGHGINRVGVTIG